MKLTKENVCVFIENEAQIEEARKMLEKYGEIESKSTDSFIYEDGKYPYLQEYEAEWYLSQFTWENEQITLQQLEEILKEPNA